MSTNRSYVECLHIPFIPTEAERALITQFPVGGVGYYEPCGPGCKNEATRGFCHCQACGETGRMLLDGYCATCAPTNHPEMVLDTPEDFTP